MRRRCPNCRSYNVRRSSREIGAEHTEPILRSPFRCRDCQTKFWALGTKVYRRIVLAVALNVALVAVILGFILTFEGR